MQVAGLHRAGPSATLDKAVQLCVIDYIPNFALVKGQIQKNVPFPGFRRVIGPAGRAKARRREGRRAGHGAFGTAQVSAAPVSLSKIWMTLPPKVKFISSP